MEKLAEVSSAFSGLDAQDVASYKWAKQQAAAIVEKESRSIMNSSSNHSDSTATRSQSAHRNHARIRPPTNAGVLRSASASSQSSLQYRYPNTRNTSITPVKRNTETNAQPRLPPTGGHGLRTRTRSTSPPSQHKAKSKSKSKTNTSSIRRRPSQKAIQPKISQAELSLRKHYFKKTFTFQSPQP
eukprot:scaffold2388_cov119-Chaetoceros_neogracile.AAC.1